MLNILLWMSVYTYHLDNGTDVIIDELAGTKSVSVRVYVKNTGSIYEKGFYGTGISHYFEHLLAEGSTDMHTEGEYEDSIKKMGLYMNAYTSYDHTCFYLNGSYRFTGPMIHILYEWISHSRLDSFEVAREKGVIKKEILLRTKDPVSRSMKRFFELFLNGHPSSYPIIGYEENFNRITREDLLSFYKERYIPGNLIVAVGGDVKHENVIKIIDSTFATLPHKKGTYFPIENIYPDPSGLKEFTLEDKLLTSPIVIMGFLLSPENQDNTKLYLFSYIINDILSKKLEDEQSLVSRIYAYPFGFKGVNFYFVFAKVNNVKDIGTVKESIFDIFSHPEKYITTSVLKRKKHSFILRKYQEKRVEWHVSEVALNYMYSKDVNAQEHWEEKVKTLALKAIIKTVKKYLVKDNAFVVNFVKEPILEENKKLTEIDTTITEITLKNNARIFLKKTKKFPTFLIRIGLKGGLFKGKLPLHFALHMLNNSIGGMDRERYKAFLEENALRCYVSDDEIGTYLYIYGYKDNIDAALDLVNTIFKNPVFTEKEFKLTKKEFLEEIKHSGESSIELSWRAFSKIYYKNHPSRFESPDSLEINALTLNKIKNAYKNSIMKNSNIFALVYGDINKARVKKRLEKILSNIPPSNIEIPRDVSYPADTTVIYTYKHPQVNILIAYKGTYAFTDDYFALRIIGEMFSSAQGRLHNALRGERDLVYAGNGYMRAKYITPPYMFFAQTDTLQYKKVIDVILNEIEKLKKGKITDEEVNAVKSQIVNKIDSWYHTEYDISENHLDMLMKGKNIYYADKGYKEGIKKITKEDIIRVSKKYFNHPFIFITKPE